MNIINSRDVSLQVPEIDSFSQYRPQRVLSVRIWVSRIFPRNWNSRIFSRIQLPRQWCFRGKNLCFPFLAKFCPERQCDFSRVDLREKMWDTGKFNKHYQLPSLRISSSDQLPGNSSSLVVLPSAEFQGALFNNPREFIYEKRCENSGKVNKYCQLPRYRIFTSNQFPGTSCFPVTELQRLLT
jgi:hypothetical protein